MNPKYTRIFRPLLALGAAIGLSACASVNSVDSNDYYDATSRAASVEVTLNASADPATPDLASSNFKVVAVNVSVPRALRVSEANRYYPSGDIVWREDPIGDRYAQVDAIVTAGLTKGVAGFDGEREVVLDVVVTRFHALTEKARYTIGGVHAIQFDMRVRDAETGEILQASRSIKADFDALGGQAAVASEARGVTQKVRIIDHLAFVINQEMGRAGGYAERDNGLVGAINQL